MPNVNCVGHEERKKIKIRCVTWENWLDVGGQSPVRGDSFLVPDYPHGKLVSASYKVKMSPLTRSKGTLVAVLF